MSEYDLTPDEKRDMLAREQARVRRGDALAIVWMFALPAIMATGCGAANVVRAFPDTWGFFFVAGVVAAVGNGIATSVRFWDRD
jgi:hypothetical protein